MKIFLIFKGHGKEMVPVIKALESHGHQVIYWLGLDNDQVDNFPHIIFHKDADAEQGLPAQKINQDYAPAGQDLIDKFYATESRVMNLMDKKLSRLSVPEKKHLYYQMLGYWYGVLNEYKPDVIIFPTSPARSYNNIIHDLAESMDIKKIMCFDTLIEGRTSIFQDNWHPTGRKLLQEMARNEHKNFSLDELSQDIKKYYQKHTDQSQDSTPYYTKQLKKRFSAINILKSKSLIIAKHLKNGTIFKLIWQYLQKIFGQNLQKEYRQHITMPDFNKKFVYLPLQLQPERSTSPLGKMFVDQIQMIKILSHALPDNWMIYVKEHPHQWWSDGINYSVHRYRGYYDRIAKIKNVKLIDIKTDTYKLISQASAVAAVTGSPAWEGVLRGKPALIFGYPWFKDCPGIFSVNNSSQCQAAFKQIEQGYKINNQDLINYLAALDGATARCMIDDLGQERFAPKVTGLTLEQRRDNFIKAILEELDEIK